jgi:hypothetical protein
MIDLPIYRRLGLSAGMEYFIPINNVGLDVESPFSGYARLYYDF